MTFQVRVTAEAKRDLLDITRFLHAREGEEEALRHLTRLEQAMASLATLPERGNHPPELERVGVLTYRERHEPPWRVIYEVSGEFVYIHAVLDARRDIQSLLTRRVLRH